MKLLTAKILSTCFGIGFFPVAPGTFTSVVAVFCYYFLPALHNPLLLFSLVLLCSGVGIWAGGVMEEQYGNDPSIVTIDELAGQWLALVALPEGALPLLLSLAFFRLFDIAKPGPVDALQRLPGGWGIMLDDLLAGLFANLSVRALLLLLSLFHFWPSL
ncbi:phosphatidylglycerophosphatase A family protein [Pelodictyon phaeoclathratiforme]|jgi:phosphatidylglycerophosphatase A|uniref:Phosphatidylglycerophosphatase A n=1 Tax=Pelodictyon phaeoclathratiforme (strain DSM 5477 / BU-1) TaxID=324925 RepID=B4SDQ2_PELPB|nr:phosphatidylglycerophosphatase A [Pelodictyon phaeoclathratiforme]ACF44420.1 phosphatidylglycerophosphatase A [Pelodictyon phaeoclathratiforme BU-1]MBV5289368.1 phosphatidylglycerophosphatase A [Pelodictyon phaeoclathratiforme]